MEQKIEPALFPVRELEEREFEPATRLIFTKVQLDGDGSRVFGFHFILLRPYGER